MVAVGLSRLEVAVGLQKNTAYVVNSFGDWVSIIDINSGTVMATVDGGKWPWDVKGVGRRAPMYRTTEPLYMKLARLFS